MNWARTSYSKRLALLDLARLCRETATIDERLGGPTLSDLRAKELLFDATSGGTILFHGWLNLLKRGRGAAGLFLCLERIIVQISRLADRRQDVCRIAKLRSTTLLSFMALLHGMAFILETRVDYDARAMLAMASGAAPFLSWHFLLARLRESGLWQLDGPTDEVRTILLQGFDGKLERTDVRNRLLQEIDRERRNVAIFTSFVPIGEFFIFTIVGCALALPLLRATL